VKITHGIEAEGQEAYQQSSSN